MTRVYTMLFLAGLFFGISFCAFTQNTCAQRNERDQLALELAVVAAHEGALDNTKDTALIWQVIESRADTVQARREFLRAHSPKALGLPSRKGPCLAGENCEWSAQLLRHPDAPPAALSASWWNAARADRWALVRRKASELVYGIERWRPCPAAPYSWGYAGDVQSAWKERRLVPLGCAGTLNEGFAPAPKELLAFIRRKPVRVSASLAKGARP